MGVVKKQSLQSSIFIYLGFLVGGINVMFLFPKFFSLEQIGLTRVLFAAGATISSLSFFGVNRIMLKFFPFYKAHLKRENNDFLFLSFLFPILGFILIVVLSLLFKGQLFEAYSKKSPLFIDYFYLIYPAGFSIMIFYVFEAYAQNLIKGVLPSILRELGYRIFITIAIILYALNLFNFKWFMIVFSSYYFVASGIMFLYIYRLNHFHFKIKISNLTRRLKGKMMNYGLFMYGGTVIAILAENMDTFMIAGISGLGSTAVFTMATFIATILKAPQRAIVGIVTPLISKAWREKDLNMIDKIYKRSSINLMIITGLVFTLLWLNIDTIFGFLPKGFEEGKYIVLILSMSVMIDLFTSVNSEILFTSNSWKIYFLTHVGLLAISIPANYFLIKKFGIMGSAFSNLIAFTAFNGFRYLYIKVKYKLEPFTIKSLYCLLIFLGAYFIVSNIHFTNHLILNSILKSIFCLGLLVPMLLVFNISEDVNSFWNKWSKLLLKK